MRYFGPGCLAGITLADWLSLLITNGFCVSPAYLGKAAFVSGSSVVTSLLRPLEQFVTRRALDGFETQPPVFIVGCWRSGTTHLHNLMCLDQRFTGPTLYQTMYPHTFVLTESWLLPFLDLMTPRKRFMDNMEQGLREPHEDEMALAIMSQCSNMLSWAFPRNAARYDAFLDFQTASETEIERWKSCVRIFVNKVAMRSRRRVVLKSPNHTARLGLLRSVFPEARFLHIRRDPYDVFRSMCHMASQVQPVWGFQRLPPEQIPEMVLQTYARLYQAYLDQASSLPSTHLHEITYEELVQNPLQTIKQAYDALELGEFQDVEPGIRSYLAKRATYTKNKHAELPPEQLKAINAAWEKFFAAWNYRVQNVPCSTVGSG